MAVLPPEEKLRRLRKDIVVKLSKTFEDCLISNTGYVFDYDTSNTKTLAIMKPGYTEMLFPQFLEKRDEPVVIIHIKSAEELKKAIDEKRDEPIELITKAKDGTYPPNLQAALKTMDLYDSEWIRNDAVSWARMDISDKDLDLMYEDNMVINYPGIQAASGHPVTIGKSLLPYTNKKTVTEICRVSMLEMGKGVYAMLIQTDVPYFTYYSKFMFI